MEVAIDAMCRYDERLPLTNSSQEIAAGRLWLASRAKKKIDAIFAAAMKQAELEDVQIDKVNSKLEPGTTDHPHYVGVHFMNLVSVKLPREGFDKDKARSKMEELKIPAAKIKMIMEAGRRVDRPAHVCTILPRNMEVDATQ